MKLDDITIGSYQTIGLNVTTAYIPYYKDAAVLYSDTTKGAGKIIKDQQLRIADIMGLLGRTLGSGVTPITRKELKKLDNLLEELKKVHKQVDKWVKESSSFDKSTAKSLKGLSISPADIKDISMRKKGLIGRAKQAGTFTMRHPFWGAIFGGLGWREGLSFARGALGAATQLAGPVAPLVTPALGVLGGLGYGTYRAAKWGYDKYRDRGEEGIVDETLGTLSGTVPGAMPGAIPGAVPGILAPTVGAFRTRTRRQKEEATESLFYFFNKR
ncbi:MAG: hypothetical protein ACTSUP_06030, partial [Candidatus Heimdallarchaeaceae archaeon]